MYLVVLSAKANAMANASGSSGFGDFCWGSLHLELFVLQQCAHWYNLLKSVGTERYGSPMQRNETTFKFSLLQLAY
jgi:hypothetical protein